MHSITDIIYINILSQSIKIYEKCQRVQFTYMKVEERYRVHLHLVRWIGADEPADRRFTMKADLSKN